MTILAYYEVERRENIWYLHENVLSSIQNPLL
jgi:hypothetical protein